MAGMRGQLEVCVMKKSVETAASKAQAVDAHPPEPPQHPITSNPVRPPFPPSLPPASLPPLPG
jgi:hypothetical protein